MKYIIAETIVNEYNKGQNGLETVTHFFHYKRYESIKCLQDAEILNITILHGGVIACLYAW